MPVTFIPSKLYADGPRILAHSVPSVSAGTNANVIVIDATDARSPQETARITLKLPGDCGITAMASLGRDLVVSSNSTRYGDPCRFIGWYRFSENFTSARRMSSLTEYYPGNPGTVAITDGYAILAVASSVEADLDEWRTLVLRLDVEEGLVPTYDESSRTSVTEYEVDEARGLVFAMGTSELQILDLGVLTTGEASWPD